MDVETARSREDLQLIERYFTGDEYAVEELVMKYQKKIYALAYRMTGNIEDSKDLTQKTFLQAFGNLKEFKKKSSFYTWLYQIALNACLNHVNKKGRTTEEINDSFAHSGGNALSAIIETEKEAHLKRSLNELPERQQAAVILRAYEGLSLKETAVVMKCSEGAVKAHYHNGVKKLKEVLKKRGYEIGS